MIDSEYKERYIQRIPETGCWIWMGCTWTGGYGYVRIKGKHIPAHRYIYSLYKKNIPKELDACHTCDVPCCVNPDHIWPGTVSDNMKDAYRKGRKSQKGFKNGNYKHGLCTKNEDIQ